MLNNEKKIDSIDRALDILMLLYHEQRELGVTEIGSRLNLYKSTVHRTLSTLEDRGFVEQNSINGKYWLGMSLYALGMVAGEKMTIKHVAEPYAKQLSDRFNEVVNVSVLDKDMAEFPRSIIIVKEERHNQILRVNPSIGSSSECHCSAVGKCLLAFSKPGVLKVFEGKAYPVHTRNTIGDWLALDKALKQIKEQGYAVDDEESEIGLSCIAAPILDRSGYAIAAISLTGPASRIKVLNFAEVVNTLQETAEHISGLLK